MKRRQKRAREKENKQQQNMEEGARDSIVEGTESMVDTVILSDCLELCSSSSKLSQKLRSLAFR